MPFGDVVGQQVPSNERLWDMLVVQAKHRFRVYPSMAASKWIHDQYIKEGGQFVRSKKDVHPSLKRDKGQSEDKPKRKLSPEEKKRVIKALKHKKRRV